jgi:carbamoyltransferase
MVILGIGGVMNDAAAAIMVDGELRVAVEQRKIARSHRPGVLPVEAVDTCIRTAQIKPEEVDCAALVRPIGASPESALHLQLRARFPNAQIVLVDHHVAHAASAFYASPFEEATVLTLDRAGDLRCGARWQCDGVNFQLDRELYFPDSLGDLYSRVAAFLGYTPNADEHKVQWLSAAGDDRFVEAFLEMLSLDRNDWPRLDRSFFDSHRLYGGGFGTKFYKRFGLDDGAEVPAKLRPHVAAGIQRAIERSVLTMAGSGKNLALAGGLALNALLIASIEASPSWENVFVQPAAGNAGTALGAVFYAWHNVYKQTRRSGVGNLCLGPEFGPEDVKQTIENCKLRPSYLRTTTELIDTAVGELKDNKIIAWMQGKMEFGPRALGNRSILASPSDPYSTENLNLFIKHREPFRKFAASVPAELAGQYFEVGPNARFLATLGRVKAEYRKTFEAAILGQDLVRVHAVSRDDNPLYWQLLHRAGEALGLPVLYNTSFNLFGDPLVCSPRDAVRSFYSSGIDSMIVGHFILRK